MKVTEYARKVTLREGKKKSITIAQVMEVLKIMRKDFRLLCGVDLYKEIHKIKSQKRRK